MVHEELKIGNGDFDKLFPGVTKRFAEKIFNTFAKLSRSAKRLKQQYPEDMRNSYKWKSIQYCWMLLGNAANSLIAGFVLLEKGYIQEPLAIARVAMERLMCAVLMNDNPEIVPKFEAGKQEDLYKKGVGAVNKVINGFGKMWGSLSSPGTHVSRENITTIIAEQDGIRIGGFFDGTDEEKQVRRRLIGEFFVMTELVETAPEQIFFNESRPKAMLSTNK